MRKKPKGRRFANLTARGGAIYYQRVLNGRRVRFSTETDDWDLAAAVKAEYEAETGAAPALDGKVPTFGELCERYLEECVEHLAPSTLEDRRRLLRDGGPIRSHFDGWPVDAIRKGDLVAWYQAAVSAQGRTRNSGRNDVVALAAVFAYAVDLDILDASPVDAFRKTLNRQTRTKTGRAAVGVSENARPIEDPAALAAFVRESRAQGGVGHMADLLMLDAGLRHGEAEALRWDDIWWGRREDGAGAQLLVRESLSRGRHMGVPKSGRERRVDLSKRLRAALLAWHLERGRPDGGERVLDGLFRPGYRKRHFKRACERAGIGHRRPKDLRDTFASHLLSAGVQLAYVSSQLGHSDVAVTARHYARWTGGDRYAAPMAIGPEEVPADLLARIEARKGDPRLTPPRFLSRSGEVSK